MMRLDLLWEEPFHWNGQCNCWHLAKSLWKFKDLNDQLAAYRQQWQSDQQKQTMLKMTSRLPYKPGDGKQKIMKKKITTLMVVASTDASTDALADARGIMDAEVADEDAEAAVAEIMTTRVIL
jgi:hypothetical protein